MKITKVSILRFWRQLDGLSWNPAFRWNERQAPLLLIETAGGVAGIGEAWSRYTDIATVLDELERIAPALIGLTLDAPRDLVSQLGIKALKKETAWATAAALSAADIAIWDACARARQQPVWQTLGGAGNQAPVYASGGLYRDHQTLDELEQVARGYIERGFERVKMKVGALSLQEDLARVGAVRRAIGDKELWVDAVNQLDAANAMAWCEALLDLGVSAIQSPVPFQDVKTMAAIKRSGLAVIAAESEYGHAAFESLLQADAVSCLQFCLPLCGGFSGALALDDLAAKYGVKTTPQCFSTSIVQAATLQFAAARPNVACAEYHCFHDHLTHLYRDSAGSIAQGYASAGNSPGLGIDIPATGLHSDTSVISPYKVFE